MSVEREQVTTRVDPDTADGLRELCDARSESMSACIRRLLLEELGEHGFLDEETKKALGMDGGDG